MLFDDGVQDAKQLAERNLFYFIDGILGTEPGFEQLSPVLHKEMCRFLQNPLQKRKLMLVPRDHFKSTLLKGMVLHFLIQPENHNIYFPGMKGTDTCILIGFDAIENAKKFFSVIKGVIEHHKAFKNFWPHVEPMERSRWTQEQITVKRSVNYGEATVEAVSINSPVASRHVDALFLDDIFTFRAMHEPPTAEKTILWHKSIVSVLRKTNHSFIIVAGTPWAQNDVYNDIINNMPDYQLYHRACIENGKPIFPERYSLEDLIQIQQRFEGTGLFELNYMCDHAGGVLSDFKKAWFKRFAFAQALGKIYFEPQPEQATPLSQAVVAAMSGKTFDVEFVAKTLGLDPVSV